MRKILSFSLIDKMYRRGNPIPRCPMNLYRCTITEEVKGTPSDAMLKGCFFETLCLGSTAREEVVIDLPRKRLSKKQELQNIIAATEGKPVIMGEKTIDQIRIEEQVKRFEQLCREREMVIVKGINTQNIIYKRIPGTDWIGRGTIDAFPVPITLNKEHILTGVKGNVCLFDQKLTADLLKRTYRGTIWGDARTVEWFQLIYYAWLLKNIDFSLNDAINPGNKLRSIIIPFHQNLIRDNNLLLYYWVFEYKNANLGNRMIEVTYDILKEKEMLESIRKSISDLELMESMGYPTEPLYEVCKDCPIRNCPVRDETERI